MSAEITCGRCGEIWTGLSKAHCATCHRTFTTAGAFDLHRVDLECAKPWRRGLKFRNGLWGYPGSPPKDLWPEIHHPDPTAA